MPSTILSDNGVSSGTAGIKTTGSNDGILELQTTTAGGTATTAVSINTTQQVAVTAGTAAAPSIIPSGDTNTGIFFPAADTIAFAEGGAEAMRIDSDGDVGIGTTSPSFRLDVQSATTAQANFQQTNANSYGEIRVTGNSRGGQIEFMNGATRLAGMYADTSNNLIFANGTGDTERARIDSSGNLLVGITSARANAGDVQVSKGISFPATQSAQSDVNTLDDYEEGTWSTTLTNCGGSASASGANYVKIGKVVTARLTIANGTFTLNSSNFTLPFSSAYLSTGTFSIATTTGGFLEAQASNVCYFVTTASGTAYCSITYIAS